MRLLFDAGELTVEDVAERLSLALSSGHPPKEQAAWAEGVLAGNALLLLHTPSLLRVIDAWLIGLPGEQFTDVLPVVRRAFGGWEPPERQTLALRVRHLDRDDDAVEEDLDMTEMAVVLAVVDEILEAAR